MDPRVEKMIAESEAENMAREAERSAKVTEAAAIKEAKFLRGWCRKDIIRMRSGSTFWRKSTGNLATKLDWGMVDMMVKLGLCTTYGEHIPGESAKRGGYRIKMVPTKDLKKELQG